MARNPRRVMRELYDQVPGIECKGFCADSCGPIEMSALERAAIAKRGVTITAKEDALAEYMEKGDFDCDALVDGRCSVYEDRPMVCRLWGVTESLACPYGCATPEGTLTDSQGWRLLAAAMQVGGDASIPDMDKVSGAFEKHREQLAPFLQAMRPTDQRGSR